MNKKWFLGILTGILLVTLTGIWGYNQYQEKQRVEHYLGNRYRQAFYEMVEYIEDIQILLGKSLVSVSPRHNIISLTNIWSKALNAQEQLTNLPLSTSEIHRTASYLSQTGDYAHTIARKNAEGKAITKKEREQLAKLRKQAVELNKKLHELGNDVLEERMEWRQIVEGTRKQAQDIEKGKFRDSMEKVEQELNKEPTLVYDGPFSDHVSGIKPRGLKGDEISSSEAEKKAREVIDIEEGKQLTTIDSGSTKGRIEAYNFNIERKEGDEYSVDISKKGGHLINIIGSRERGQKEYDLQEAKEKAKKYLAAAGYPKMKATYGEVEDDTAFISFAYQNDDVIFYPDLINVRLALDKNQVISVDALKYLTFHQERELEEPEITEDEAKNMAEDRLDEIEDVKLAVIPDESLKEILTYEIKGSVAGEEYLIYINARTGIEEEILQLIRTEKGSFTI
ncbi:MAG: germination protein YpeB [Halanaerobiaceae bacterium]